MLQSIISNPDYIRTDPPYQWAKKKMLPLRLKSPSTFSQCHYYWCDWLQLWYQAQEFKLPGICICLTQCLSKMTSNYEASFICTVYCLQIYVLSPWLVFLFIYVSRVHAKINYWWRILQSSDSCLLCKLYIIFYRLHACAYLHARGRQLKSCSSGLWAFSIFAKFFFFQIIVTTIKSLAC